MLNLCHCEAEGRSNPSIKIAITKPPDCFVITAFLQSTMKTKTALRVKAQGRFSFFFRTTMPPAKT
jgi:hypothetical protein